MPLCRSAGMISRQRPQFKLVGGVPDPPPGNWVLNCFRSSAVRRLWTLTEDTSLPILDLISDPGFDSFKTDNLSARSFVLHSSFVAVMLMLLLLLLMLLCNLIVINGFAAFSFNLSFLALKSSLPSYRPWLVCCVFLNVILNLYFVKWPSLFLTFFFCHLMCCAADAWQWDSMLY